MDYFLDFTNASNTGISLAKILNTKQGKILSYINFIGRNKDINLEEFFKFIYDMNLDTYEILNNIKIDNIIVKHVTTNLDNCESINKYGLVNLQKSLELDTCLNIFFKKHNIRFVRKYNSYDMYYNDKKIDLIINNSHNDDFILSKLITDYQINAFLYSNNPTSYSRIKDIPEFLDAIIKKLSAPSIEDDWLKNKKTYILNLTIPIDNLNDSIFIDDFKNNFQLIDKYEWFIKKALTYIHSSIFKLSCEKYIWLKNNVTVPPKNIKILPL